MPLLKIFIKKRKVEVEAKNITLNIKQINIKLLNSKKISS